MLTKRHLSRLVIGGILGATVLLSAGNWISTAEAAPKRDRQARVEHRDRRVERRGDRRQDRREDRRVVRRVERRDDRRVVVYHHPRYYRPRPVVMVRHPWYTGVRRVYIHDEPFYFNAGLGVYLGGAFLNFEFTNAAPDGYLYYDPYCHETFASVDLYRHHLAHHRHDGVLSVIQANIHLR
jgi:hypothetical protein